MKNEKGTITKRISRQGLLNLLTEFRKNFSATGTAFGNVVYFVDESKSVQKEGKKQLQKLTCTPITIGASYEKRVNKILAANGEETNFTAQSMSGKEYVNDERVIATDTKTKTKFYLVADIETRFKPITHYFHKGKKITIEEAKAQNLFTAAFGKEQSYGRGYVAPSEAPARIINPNIDNIVSITLNKRKYIVED
jgi:hypothetical protein